jgi:hypothetical protein
MDLERYGLAEFEITVELLLPAAGRSSSTSNKCLKLPRSYFYLLPVEAPVPVINVNAKRQVVF